MTTCNVLLVLLGQSPGSLVTSRPGGCWLQFWYALHILSWLLASMAEKDYMIQGGWERWATGNLKRSLSWSNTIQSLVRKFVAFCLHRCKLSTHLKTFSWRILQSKLVFKFLISNYCINLLIDVVMKLRQR